MKKVISVFSMLFFLSGCAGHQITEEDERLIEDYRKKQAETPKPVYVPAADYQGQNYILHKTILDEQGEIFTKEGLNKLLEEMIVHQDDNYVKLVFCGKEYNKVRDCAFVYMENQGYNENIQIGYDSIELKQLPNDRLQFNLDGKFVSLEDTNIDTLAVPKISNVFLTIETKNDYYKEFVKSESNIYTFEMTKD